MFKDAMLVVWDTLKNIDELTLLLVKYWRALMQLITTLVKNIEATAPPNTNSLGLPVRCFPGQSFDHIW